MACTEGTPRECPFIVAVAYGGSRPVECACSPSLLPPLQFFAADPEKGVRRPISPQFPIRFSLVLLEFRFVDIAIQLNTCFLRARKFYRISLKFHSFLFPFFRFIRNIRIFFTFFCLETSPHFANFSMIFFEFEKNNARC